MLEFTGWVQITISNKFVKNTLSYCFQHLQYFFLDFFFLGGGGGRGMLLCCKQECNFILSACSVFLFRFFVSFCVVNRNTISYCFQHVQYFFFDFFVLLCVANRNTISYCFQNLQYFLFDFVCCCVL